jgi:hypothetical protein
MRLKQFGYAIEAELRGCKRFSRQVGVQQRKALEGRKSSRAESLLSEPEPNADGEASESLNSEVGAILGGRGWRYRSRAVPQDTRKELGQ